MRDYPFSNQQIAELRAAHLAARDVREAYRINAVILLGVGWTTADVSAALLVEADTVRAYFKRYEQGGLDGLVRMSYLGTEALLDAERSKVLDAHSQQPLYPTAEAVARYVEQRWGVCYTASGMTAVLHRLGYSYKKAQRVRPSISFLGFL